MALRVIEIVTPRSDKDEVKQSLEEHQPDQGYVFWASPLDDGESLSFRVVLDVEQTENVMDKMEKLFAWTDKYRIVVYAAEATLPRLDKLAKEENGQAEEEVAKEEETAKGRISREELYADVLDTTLLSRNYLMLVFFSSLVGVIGLLRDNVAIIIGAMVLAPLLGPNVGLALATTLGDIRLTRESLKTLTVGIIICLLVSTATGLLFGITFLNHELEIRSVTSYSDIILAIVSGAAGIISFTLGVPTSLIGVMVALSLLPPLIACGLFLGSGMFIMAGGGGAALPGQRHLPQPGGRGHLPHPGHPPPLLVREGAGQEGDRPDGGHLDRTPGRAGRPDVPAGALIPFDFPKRKRPHAVCVRPLLAKMASPRGFEPLLTA